MAADRPPLRTDIEGLRGIAILLVVLFHAGVPGVTGAFVGVDVFFVLSGFFITGLLLRELAVSGDVALGEFWGRRALRLLPPLLVVLLATLAFATFLYAPIDRPMVASTARAVAMGASNVAFASDGLNYFGRDDNPLLHTWSLAVEQQFYLLWPPLVLLIAFAAVPGRTGSPAETERVERRRMLIGLAIAALLSLVAAVRLTEVAQPWAFFGTPARIWEFALGGMLAVALQDRTGTAGAWRGTMLQLAGLGAIAVAVAAYDRVTPYPGTAALLPAFGAGALLVGGWLAPASVVSRTLGVAPLRWLGRVSYAWYLWHWPLVGLGGVLNASIGVGGKLAWSALALVLAWLTWRLVEEPARNGGRLARIPSHWLPAAAVGASAAAALVAHGAMTMAVRRVAQPDQRPFAQARGDRMPHDCWATTVEDARTASGACEFGDRTSATTVVLLGDSHAEHWLGGLDRVGRERGWKIVAMVKGGCPVADIPEGLGRRGARQYRECVRYREAMLQRIVAMRPSLVILSSWDHYVPVGGAAPSPWQVTPGAWERGLRRTYARLAAASIPMVALRDNPRTWFDVPACLSRKAAGLPFARACTYERAHALSRVAIDAQTAAARGLPVRLLDMNDQICATARCAPIVNGTVVYTDDNHLTASFTRSLAPVLGPRLEEAALAAGARLR